MSPTVDPQELKRQRRDRRNNKDGGKDGRGSGEVDVRNEPVIAQGRPQPMLGVEDIPDAIDAPEAHGPLSSDEEERWELCKLGFQQFQKAWWVAAKALDVSLRGRLWRSEYDTAEAFIGDVASMSTSNAYRQIAGAEVAALLASPPKFELESNDSSRMRDSTETQDPFESESNDLSRMRDSTETGTDPEPLVISQRAAEALAHVREDYGAGVAAEAYRTVAQATGKDKVSQKTITGIVQQLPRKKEEELHPNEFQQRVRTLAVEQSAKEAAARKAAADPIEQLRKYVDAVEAFAQKTDGMTAAYEKAASVDKRAANALARKMRDHMARAAENFPDV